ncbi:MAG: type II toxin-antitoxin system VapC family toxin [Pseudomonadota bacterium]|uniref:type II toxin-antitoxin system VapC family toxin n=1 Tax=Silanimonas sp. TaxID=1929290 RepID=UPI0022BF21A6|nr:type II toxin-antitoxin system VapC family toxin [Silanimonas sp.]MCZ8116186.1 type II toxin-antitoxin system VapC family toxin [Silanimonas sp.]
MRLLLDTQVFFRAVTGSAQLKAAAREQLTAAERVYVSAASIWEMAIKSRLGKIEGDVGSFVDAIEASGFQELPVTAHHAAAVAALPMHHADPFDRLLLAQAFTEPLRLVTADAVLTQYGGAIELL